MKALSHGSPWSRAVQLFFYIFLCITQQLSKRFLDMYKVDFFLNNSKLNSDWKWMLLTCGCFRTISGHFFANYMSIFHKSEVQMVILRCLTGLNSDWFKSYDTKCKYFHFWFFCNFVLLHTFAFFCVFAFCVITFVPIKI